MLGISSSRWGIHWEWQEEKNHGVLQDVSKAASIPGFYNMYIMSCVSSLISRFYHLSRSVRPDLSRYSFSLLHRLNFKVSNIIPPQWNDCPKWLLHHDQQNILYTIKWIENDCYAWPTRAGESDNSSRGRNKIPTALPPVRLFIEDMLYNGEVWACLPPWGPFHSFNAITAVYTSRNKSTSGY